MLESSGRVRPAYAPHATLASFEGVQGAYPASAVLPRSVVDAYGVGAQPAVYVWSPLPAALDAWVRDNFHATLNQTATPLSEALCTAQNVEWLLNQARYTVWLRHGFYVDPWNTPTLNDLTTLLQKWYFDLQPHDVERAALPANLQRVNAYVLADLRPRVLDMVRGQVWWLRQLQVPVPPPLDRGLYTKKRGEDPPPFGIDIMNHAHLAYIA